MGATSAGSVVDVGARSKARKRAVDILFESDLRGLDPLELLAERVGAPELPPVSDYTISLVHGEVARRHVVDDRQRAEVLGADREHLAVVVTSLALDRRGVASQWSYLVDRQLLQTLEIDDDLGGRFAAG